MVQDLGVLDGQILVFGGPYSNFQATQAVLDKAKELHIPPSNIICTGDVTAYCGNPQETSKILKESGVHIIQGNCDESLANDSDDCDCGFGEDTVCEVLADRWYNFSKSNTDPDLKKWMGTLPFRIEFIYGGKKFHVLHGSDEKINEFVFSSSPDDHKYEQIEQTGADIVLCGHNGIHFTSVIKDKVWHNAGVVGMPANDGTTRGWYSVISQNDEGIIFSHKVLEYDYQSAAEAMRENGLMEYVKTVETGLWPSLDVLPEAEKAQTGIARQEEDIFYAVNDSRQTANSV